MKKLLIPVRGDSPARTRAALADAVRLANRELVHVYLLSVQPVMNGHVALFFGTVELRNLQEKTAREELEQPEKLLATAGVRYTSIIEIGRSAETIAGTARRIGCDQIIFGEEPASMGHRVFGTVAQQVRHLLGRTAGCKVSGS